MPRNNNASTGTERRSITFAASELRILANASGGPMLAGYAAKFDLPSFEMIDPKEGRFIEYIRAGAFDLAVAEDDIRCLVDHESTLILGRNKAGTLRVSVDDIGLYFECDLPDTQTGRDTPISVGRGDVDGCSFGFQTVRDAWSLVDGVKTRELLEVRLFDVGPVTFPAYADTEVSVRMLESARAATTLQPPMPKRNAALAWLNSRSK